MGARRDWISFWTAVSAALAWVLANGLDVFSVLLVVQGGGQLALARYHTAEWFLIYAGMRMLGTLALCLMIASVSRRWPSASRMAWSVLTACSFVTAVAAWWRLYR